MMQVVDHVETRRLVLRRWTLQDLDALVAVFEKPEVWRFPFQRGLTHEETGSLSAPEARRMGVERMG